MSGFEPRISGVGCDRSANCATTSFCFNVSSSLPPAGTEPALRSTATSFRARRSPACTGKTFSGIRTADASAKLARGKPTHFFTPIPCTYTCLRLDGMARNYFYLFFLPGYGRSRNLSCLDPLNSYHLYPRREKTIWSELE